MQKIVKLDKLRCTFPKLTEKNQHYVLGLAEGLKYAQVKEKTPLKMPGNKAFYTGDEKNIK